MTVGVKRCCLRLREGGDIVYGELLVEEGVYRFKIDRKWVGPAFHPRSLPVPIRYREQEAHVRISVGAIESLAESQKSKISSSHTSSRREVLVTSLCGHASLLAPRARGRPMRPWPGDTATQPRQAHQKGRHDRCVRDRRHLGEFSATDLSELGPRTQSVAKAF
jgi:hypothetical protein